jgi:very-short-patch-repair endonuclease
LIHRSLSPELLEICREQRKKPTEAEAILWECLRNSRLKGYKFRRQHPAGGYILDFYCPVVRVGIEVDGGIHLEKEQVEYDRMRSNDLAELGIEVIRFWNSEIITQPGQVLNTILYKLIEKTLARTCELTENEDQVK